MLADGFTRKNLRQHKGIYSFIVTHTIQVRTITNYIIPPHIGGAHFHDAPSWPASSINTELYTQRKDDHWMIE